MGGDNFPHTGGIETVRAVEAVRSQTDNRCHASLCHDSGCWLTMENVPVPYVLVYLEHPNSPINRRSPHCDFLYVGGGEECTTEWVAPIELTTGENRVEKFQRQIQPVASQAEKLIPKNVKVRFRPIAVHGKENTRKAERNRRRRLSYQIEFRFKKYPFKLVYCGTALSQALSGQ